MDKRHLLVIDDDPLSVKLLADILDLKGYRVSTAANCAIALEVINGEPVDAVITDFHLPDGNGLEVLRGARRVSREVPVFVVSVDSDAVPRDERNGVFFFGKPISVHDVVTAVEQAVPHKRSLPVDGEIPTD